MTDWFPIFVWLVVVAAVIYYLIRIAFGRLLNITKPKKQKLKGGKENGTIQKIQKD